MIPVLINGKIVQLAPSTDMGHNRRTRVENSLANRLLSDGPRS